MYGAALGGWVYLVVWGAAKALGAGTHSRPAGLVVGVIAGLAIVRDIFVAER